MKAISRAPALREAVSPRSYGFGPRWGATAPPLTRCRTILSSDRRRYQTSSKRRSDDAGHLSTARNEGILFFDNIFPLKLQWLLKIPGSSEKSLPELLKRFNNPNVAAADPMSIIKRAIPPKTPVKITEILPRLKDGGAFVKFSHDEGITASEIEGLLREHLQEKPIKPWFNPFRRVSAFLVQGKPWVEDLRRFPSSRLRVEFMPDNPDGTAAELSQETLYSLFRQYGKMADIIPQPADSKTLPKYALLDFVQFRDAIMAKNCMHGFRVLQGGEGSQARTVLRLGYEARIKAHWIRDWIFNHPRIVIPAIAAVLATITVAVFDPIRTFFIKNHVEHTFHLTNSKVYRWFKAQASDILTFRHRTAEDPGLKAIWDDRKDNIEQIQKWLMETADTFIVVQGPRGSGKKELVIDQALKDRKHTLYIDCKPVQEARGDSATIGAAAKEVGYRPVFSWMNSVSSLIDLAAQGTIGTKTGFSETLDTQLGKIWQNTAVALKQIALQGRKKDDSDAASSDDEYLEAHPERRPVVVIDNFLHKNQESSVVYDKLSEWAAALTTANVAHVIFLTHDVSFSKSLSKALPDRVFRQISLSDCSPAVAKRFVITHLDADADADSDGTEDENGVKKLTPSQRREDLGELDECIELLGGRLTDLEFLARRMKSGETPNKAVKEIVEQSASEILKMYLLDVADRSDRPWTPEQAWLLVRELAKAGELRYNSLLLSSTYAPNPDRTLQALEQAELITIHSPNGRPSWITPGKPVYSAAFRYLVDDRVLAARLDLASLTQMIGAENKSVEKCEEELGRLAELGEKGRGVEGRVRWLVDKMKVSQEKVEGWERETVGLKKTLGEEF
ncbi:MAG: mitochondrial escape protein 2 [Chaenotheca gracillima]|nr:MAG: mitochondrial escape protein 2 [Chaenotheca gracillima]